MTKGRGICGPRFVASHEVGTQDPSRLLGMTGAFVQLSAPFTARQRALTVTTLSMYPLAANVAALRLTTIGCPGVTRPERGRPARAPL